MSTLPEIEAAVQQLPPDEQQRLFIALAQRFRKQGQTLPPARQFTDAEIQAWIDEDAKDLTKVRGNL